MNTNRLDNLNNLTAQDIVLYDSDGVTILTTLPRCHGMELLRAKFNSVIVDRINLLQNSDPLVVIRHKFSLPEDVVSSLPLEEKGQYYVVGFAVLQALREAGIERPDFISPDTSHDSAVRGMGNRVIGVKNFRVF